MRSGVSVSAVAAVVGCMAWGLAGQREAAAEGSPPRALPVNSVPALTALGDGARPRSELPMQLISPAFEHQRPIPRKYTCEGDDIAPPLSWRDVPQDAVSLALVIDDPDAPDPRAPKMTWVHWVVFNIPALTQGLPEGGDPLPPGTRLGLNDWKRTQYGGPCPPAGRHRYFHKLYALDATLDLDRPTLAELEEAMRPHVLAEATLVGTYQRTEKSSATARR